ncbi:hypothetical protein O6H91_12G073000 [Diphasiastrum complanatum]|nr:hypothetical protein O6H91_12G073000 [Diphasiastrum complanatum]
MEGSESGSSNPRYGAEDDREESYRPMKLQRQDPEGEYLAALRGSNSQYWQNSLSGIGTGRGAASRGRGRSSGGYKSDRAGYKESFASGVTQGYVDGSSAGGMPREGACFNCGNEGHWATNCPHPKGSRFEAEGHQVAPKEPERLCPCGGGACLVLTANTAKNQGRKFYRCPRRKEEGQCGFFEWCDNASYGGSEVVSGATGLNYRPAQPQCELSCPCGAGTCIVRCAKTEKNMGRNFYRCPIDQEQGGCGFFKWCEEVVPSSALAHNANADVRTGLPDFPSIVAKGGIGACFKCGMSGHWSKDCTSAFQGGLLSDARTPTGKGLHGGHPTLGSCFKCGQDGHWAKDCLNSVASGPNISGNFGDRYEQKGWLPRGSDVPKTAGAFGFSKVGTKVGPPSGAAGISQGNCFKCGSPGHWASKCPIR